MRQHQEGLKISLIEQSLLNDAGILVNGDNSIEQPHGLSDESIQLFLLIAAAGDDGLPQSRIPKDLRKDLTEHLLPLEIQQLVAWERDNRGRLAYLVITWKGAEALSAARQRPSTPQSLAARRRAAVKG